MTENAKTITFVVIGLAAIALGLLTRPSSADLDEQSLVGQVLTKEFNSADDAKRLKIVRFNEDTATLREFEVAERDGLWTIPSKDGYPADAARQMAEAATSLMDRKVLSVASMSAGDHEEFGVIDPQSPKLEVGQKGVGTHVTMYDVHNEALADLVVGKAVKGADSQRYVRESGRDIVYVIEIDPAKLSTNFEDWIEKDLLKLNSWDLQQVQVKDYSAELVPVMSQQGLRFHLEGDMRSDMTLAYNDSDSKWSAVQLRQFDRATGAYTDFTLAEDEELNAESLNGLKTALDDLKIVDVVRKPQGLSNDLKAGTDFMKNEEALRSLVEKGFTPTQASDGSGAEEIISSDGEVIATMKNGTEYVLRFGNLTNVGAADKAGDAAQDGTAESDAGKSTDGGVHRYLFVMARFNEDAVKKPQLEMLPEVPAAADSPSNDGAAIGTPAPAAESATQQPADDAATSDSAAETATEAPATEPPPATEEATAASDTPAENDQPATTEEEEEEEESADASQASDASETPATTDAPSAPADSPSDASPAENNSDTPTDATAASADSAKEQPAGASADKTDSDKTKELEKLVADRKRIEQDNKRKEDDYKQLLEKGRENVKELNLRFGDWYFVVADDVFKKIRLSRENVVKKKEVKAETTGTNAVPGGVTAPGGAIPGLPPVPGTQP